jgi:hypothetical protein
MYCDRLFDDFFPEHFQTQWRWVSEWERRIFNEAEEKPVETENL